MRRNTLLLASIVLLGAWSWRGDSPAADDCRTGPCHREIDRGAVVHRPVREGSCQPCHRGSEAPHPHGEGDEFQLVLDGRDGLCYSCHGEFEKRIKGALFLHAPLRQGQCTSCHRPHAGDLDFLLTAPFPGDQSPGVPRRLNFQAETYALCWECHDVYMVLMAKTASKTAFRDGGANLHFVHVNRTRGFTCLACHPAHGSRGEKLVGRPTDWTDDLVNYHPRENGGSCAPGCHSERSYDRNR